NVSVFVIVRGPSLIVTSNGTSLNGHDPSPENPIRRVLESTRRDLIDGFNFRKQCSYITSHELPMSKYAMFTCLPDMYTLITTGSDEPSFRMGGNVISPIPFSLAGPGSRKGRSKVLASLSVARISLGLLTRLDNFLGLSKLSLRSFETSLVATSLASTQVQMCLCELILLAKVRSELCFEIFVIKDATCFLTVPPYSGGVFKGIGTNMGRHFQSIWERVDGTFPPCGRLAKLPPIGGFPSEFAEGIPWVVH
ncbi:hypothetical protein Tco_1568828, partial [Tanacetum coccineum]